MGNLNTGVAAAVLDGSVSMLTIDNSPLATPNTVFVTSSSFGVQVDWNLTGLLVPFVNGTFEIHVFAESVGPGDEKEIASAIVPTHIAPVYQEILTVPALPNPLALADGAYQLVALLTHTNIFGVKTALAGLAEGPMIQMTTP